MKIEIKPLYTVGEVAAMLHFSAVKVRRLIAAGALESERMGNLHLVPLSSLQARPALWESILMVSEIER